MSEPLITIADEAQPVIAEVTVVKVDQDGAPSRGFLVMDLWFRGTRCETVVLESKSCCQDEDEHRYLIEVDRSHGMLEKLEEIVGRFLHREQAAECEGTCPNGGDASR